MASAANTAWRFSPPRAPARRAAVHPGFSAPPPLLELEGVSKEFEGSQGTPVSVIAGVDLSVPQGASVLLRGPSGSGKTTLLGLIGCLIRPTSGRIRVGGREMTRLPEDSVAEVRRWQFGYVFQSHLLIRGATALENVVIPALPCAEVDGDLRDHARRLLDTFGLGERTHERVEKLSGGEQQRVAMARALINDPPVILADEPTAHLDAETASIFLGVIDDLVARGKTVIVASHDPLICESGRFSRVLRLWRGRLI